MYLINSSGWYLEAREDLARRGEIESIGLNMGLIWMLSGHVKSSDRPSAVRETHCLETK